jgi:hypothetical protein
MTPFFRRYTLRRAVRFGAALFFLAAASLLPAPDACAVIVVGDPGRNLTPPTGEYADSGWQYQGYWGSFTGTAIGPHHFLTAKHCGGVIGDVFAFDGRYYETIGRDEVPDCDLTVWTVAGRLPRWAALYEGRREEGREITLFGRGTSRGQAIVVDGERKGWLWGPQDGRLSWGTNWIVGAVPSGQGDSPLAQGDKLLFDFSEYGGPNEGAVSSGDSGGGLFLRDKGQWVLAGVLYGASSQYARRVNRTDFQRFDAAVYNTDGLWRPTGNTYFPARSDDLMMGPSLSIATRVSSYAPFIQSVLTKPVSAQYLTNRRTVTLLLGAMLLLLVLAGGQAAAIRGRAETKE